MLQLECVPSTVLPAEGFRTYLRVFSQRYADRIYSVSADTLKLFGNSSVLYFGACSRVS